MAWESKVLEGYLIKKIKQDDIQSEKIVSEAIAPDDPDSEGGSENEDR
jgi:hypothetical protein